MHAGSLGRADLGAKNQQRQQQCGIILHPLMKWRHYSARYVCVWCWVRAVAIQEFFFKNSFPILHPSKHFLAQKLHANSCIWSYFLRCFLNFKKWMKIWCEWQIATTFMVFLPDAFCIMRGYKEKINVYSSVPNKRCAPNKSCAVTIVEF